MLFTSLSSEVQTFKQVDINRYMGRWYEIASYPQWFEKGMTGVSAFYSLKDGYVEVVNSGYKDGVLKQAHARAIVVKDSGNAKLKVSFFRPFYGKYWIIDLATDYSWAVVSNPKRSTLWILARSMYMEDTLYDSICNTLSNNGFDTSKIIKMQQPK